MMDDVVGMESFGYTKMVSRAGADDTPREEGVYPSAGQLLAQILDSSGGERLAICSRLLEADQRAASCFVDDHKGEISRLHKHIRLLAGIVAGLMMDADERNDEPSDKNEC